MPSLAATIHGPGSPFAPTQWTVILAAANSETDSDQSEAALAQLCETYWPPLYTFLRARGHSPHDAQDLTQGFFAHLIEHQIYKRTDRQRGRFRSFLLACLKNFLADAHDRATAAKRGGGRVFVPLHEAQANAAESLFQTHGSSSRDPEPAEDRVYQRCWAETLVSTALQQLAAAYEDEARKEIFAQLRVFLTGGAAPLPSYADLAHRMGMAESSVRSHVTRLRARYRDVLRAEVRRTVKDEAEVEGELRELLRALTDG